MSAQASRPHAIQVHGARRRPGPGLVMALILVWLAWLPCPGRATTNDLFARGLEFSRAGQFPDAAETFRLLAKTRPAAGTLVNLGLAEWQCGHAGAAILAWEQARWIDPFEARAAANLRFAREVALGIPTTVVCASENDATARTVQGLFHRPKFRIYRSTDVLGVEYGGALKNISIGIASAEGKMWIHSAGVSKTDFAQAFKTNQNAFLESMAEAAGAVMNKLGDNIVYINVMNNLSIDCDCDSHPAPPELGDIGILGSNDPIALDRACVDLLYSADKKQSAALRERIESRNGTLILHHAEALGLGTQMYKLVIIDN